MTSPDAEIQANAFAKGIREITERDKFEAASARHEIRKVLGGIQKAQYYNRQNGYVKHTPAERLGIDVVFSVHGIKQPWGL